MTNLPKTAEQQKEEWKGRCPECGGERKRTATFCSATCKTNHNARCLKRGKQLLAYQMAARQTRGGTTLDMETGKECRTISDRLIQQWTEEDRKAGRMPMWIYMSGRIRCGYIAY
jgi:hypothetical protein